MQQAADLDAKFKESGPVGPLHGLPISLKDQFAVKDVELNMGYVAWIGNVSNRDSVSITPKSKHEMSKGNSNGAWCTGYDGMSS